MSFPVILPWPICFAVGKDDLSRLTSLALAFATSSLEDYPLASLRSREINKSRIKKRKGRLVAGLALCGLWSYSKPKSTQRMGEGVAHLGRPRSSLADTTKNSQFETESTPQVFGFNFYRLLITIIYLSI